MAGDVGPRLEHVGLGRVGVVALRVARKRCERDRAVTTVGELELVARPHVLVVVGGRGVKLKRQPKALGRGARGRDIDLIRLEVADEHAVAGGREAPARVGEVDSLPPGEVAGEDAVDRAGTGNPGGVGDTPQELAEVDVGVERADVAGGQRLGLGALAPEARGDLLHHRRVGGRPRQAHGASSRGSARRGGRRGRRVRPGWRAPPGAVAEAVAVAVGVRYWLLAASQRPTPAARRTVCARGFQAAWGTLTSNCRRARSTGTVGAGVIVAPVAASVSTAVVPWTVRNSRAGDLTPAASGHA